MLITSNKPPELECMTMKYFAGNQMSDTLHSYSFAKFNRPA